MSMIDEFIAVCNEKDGKKAFICKGRSISYRQLLSDLYRTVAMLKGSGIKPGDKLLVFLRPSYELYLLFFAGLHYGVNLIVTDSYKNPKRLRMLLESEQIGYVACDKTTALFRLLLGRKRKWINMSGYQKYAPAVHAERPDVHATVLTTYTSGTTGMPKPIRRSITDLSRQVRVVMNNIAINGEDVVFSKLPIYTLFVVFNGLTCVISRKIRGKELQKHQVTALLVPIAQLLKVKKPLSFISKVLIGGATLYPDQIRRLEELFPNANVEYIYGSSECVLIARTNLKYFQKEFAFDTQIQGVSVSIVNPDENGVGQVCVSGEVVLSPSKTEVSNDIGYLDARGLHVVGRRSLSANGCYNYPMDRRLLSAHPDIKKGFFLMYEGKGYFCYEGRRIPAEDDGITYLRFFRLPMDDKHKTKLNYQKALNKIIKKYPQT